MDVEHKKTAETTEAADVPTGVDLMRTWWASAPSPKEEHDEKVSLYLGHGNGTLLGGEPHGARPADPEGDQGTRCVWDLGFSAGKPGRAGYRRPLWLFSADESGGRGICR